MPSLPDFVNRLSVGAAWLAVVLFSAAGLLLALDGLSGFIVHRPVPYAVDAAQLLGLWGALLPLAFLYSARRNWSPQHFNEPVGRGAGRLRTLKSGPRMIQALVLAVSLLVTGLGLVHLGGAFEDGGWSVVAGLALPAGFALLSLQAVTDMAPRPPVTRPDARRKALR
ncbi:MAG: hypothetical protein ACK4K8_13200 [Pannonibacter sp.]